jgi:Na+/melibiose symporter-like transporter
MHYFRNPAFSTGVGGMILVFLSLYGVFFLMTQYFQLVLGYSALSASLRFTPLALTILLLSPRTPALSDRFGARTVVATGMGLIATSMLMVQLLGVDSSYWLALAAILPLAAGMALAMSPMTASIMSAVPPRRAGAGSAMNDATRELGAALGIAVLGSIAASRYAGSIAPALRGLSAADQSSAKTSIAGALHVASTLPKAAGDALALSASHAFIGGIHLAVVVGAALALFSAVVVYRKLPHSLTQSGALHGTTEALEEVAAMGLGGVPPVFGDVEDDEEREREPDTVPAHRLDQERSA